MGFSDVFGKDGFLGKLGETLQDTGWFIGAPVATAVDLARAGFDDKITFGGALSQGINRGTQLFLGDANNPDNPNDDRDNLISPSVKTAMDGLEWVYDNAIAQPINTLNIEQQRLMADVSGTEDNASPLDIGSAWKRADEKTGGYDGKGTSIGREWAYSLSAMQNLIPHALGLNKDGMTSLTDEGQKVLNEQSKTFDVQSGAIDATSRWFLDPTIVLGKASKALKFTAFIRNIDDPAKLEKALNETQAAGGLFDTFGKRLETANDFNMGVDIKGPRSAAEIYAANPGLQAAGGDGWQIAQSMESASRSMWKAGADPDEIRTAGKMISLAGLGDPTALKAIDSKAAEARDAMAAFRSQRDDLAMARDWALHQNGQASLDAAQTVANRFVDDVISRGEDYLSSDEFLAMTNERLKAITPQFRAAQSEAARIEKLRGAVEGAESSLQQYPMLASTGFKPLGLGSSAKAMANRSAKELGKPIERSPLNPLAHTDFIFQSSAWNKAVKLKVPLAAKVLAPHIYLGSKAIGKFNTPQAPRTIEFHDENAPTALNNFLKHSAVTPEKREELVSAMAAARTEGAKRSVVENAVMHAQGSMVDKYLKENPRFTEATAKIVIAEQAKQIQRESQRVGLQTRKFTAHKKQDGSPGDAIVDEDGIVKYSPLLETQLENQMVLPDLRAFTKILDHHSGWLTDLSEWAQGNRLPDANRVSELAAKFFDAKVEKHPFLDKKVSNSAEALKQRKWMADQFIDTGLSALTKAWKYGMLLRPAYPMRVLVDSDMRAMAVLGPVAFGQHFAPRAFGFLTMGSASRIKTHFAAHADEQRLVQTRTDIEKFEDKYRSEHPDAGDLTDVDPIYADLVKKKDQITARLEQYRTGGRAGRAATYGRFGEVGLKDIETVMGKIPGAFADDYGRTQRYIASSKTFAGMIGDSSKLTAANLMSENWTSLTASDAGHMDAWLHAVNAQLKQSVLGQKALEFQAKAGDNPERAVRQLVGWMRYTPEGRAIKGRMAWDTANSENFAREIVGYVNHYLPTPELRAKAGAERINRADLESVFADPLDRPPVHGQALARAMGRGSTAGKMINDWFSRSMKWLSDAPEDQLARHPMYSAIYEQEVKRQAEWLFADPNRKDIGFDEIQNLIQKRAHKTAQKSMKTYMFDVASQSDLSHALRFYSPFIAAWEDTVRKWGKIASDKPDLLGKGYLAWNAPNDLGLVVDRDGNPVAEDDFNSESYLVLRAPSWAPGIGGKELSLAGSHFRIPKQSFNIILQGGLQPGFGPLVAIPVSKLQVANPELDDVARFVNPYGPQSVWDAVAPSTVKRVQELVQTQSKEHMYDTERLYMQMLGEYRTDPEKFGGKAPTWEEAAGKAKWIGVLKILNNSSNPFPAVFDSKYKLYQDAYRDLLEKQRVDNHEQGWATDQFVKAYGESFFPLVQSMSKNNAGQSATAESVEADKKFRAEISKYGIGPDGKPNATLIRLIVGKEGEGKFNQSAHRWQETREISPASGYKFRDVSNAQEAAADADVNLGWYKYQSFINQADADANSMGLRTYKESEDLVARRDAFVQNLSEMLPAWRQDFESMDTGKFQRNIEDLSKVVDSNKFGTERTDIAGVKQYLLMRQALQQQLQQEGISEGSQDAEPYKQQFTEMVMDMVGSNTSFSEWAFHPFLERDPLLAEVVPVPGDLTQGQTAPTWGIS